MSVMMIKMMMMMMGPDDDHDDGFVNRDDDLPTRGRQVLVRIFAACFNKTGWFVKHQP